MSLLMDALKKAEEAKRQASEPTVAGVAQTPPAELTLQPVAPSAAPPGPALPNLSQQHLDSVDADLANVSTAAPPKKRQPAPAPRPAKVSTENAEAAERSAARNVFAVKQLPKSRAPLWLFIGLIGVAGAAIGGYFWWQFQAMSGNSLARPVAPMQAIANGPAQPPPHRRLPCCPSHASRSRRRCRRLPTPPEPCPNIPLHFPISASGKTHRQQPSKPKRTARSG